MTYIPPNPNGQTTMANSSPVVISSDQSAVPVTVSGVATAANQSTIIGHVDGIESVLGTIDADTSILAAATQIEDAAYTAAQRLSMIGGVRRDADTSPVTTDGDVHPLIYDELGRLKVSAQPASIAVYTDNITSNGDTVSYDVSRHSNITIYCTGTFSTVNVTFEGSIDGTNWFGVQGVRTNANTVETTTGNLSAAPAYAWELSVNALKNFRVRATAFTSGTQVWTFQAGSYATEPIPAVQTHAVTVTSGAIAATMAANATTTPAKARDGVAGASDTGIPNLFVRRDAPTAVTPIAGDYEIPQISNLGAQYVAPVAHTAGGATPYKLVSAATTNATSVKASAGQVYSVMVTNTNAAVRYFKLYNKASAPTVGTDTPVQVYAIPGATTGGGFTLTLPVGTAFATGIAFATTSGAADTDTGAVALSEILVNLTYL